MAATEALQAQARSEADALLSEARGRAKSMIDDATAYTEQLRELRRTVLSDLATVRARLEVVPLRVDHEEPLPAPPQLSSNDG